MFVSVLVPVYNVEKFLPNCIECILRQTFANFELILIDDGSLDNSGVICDQYAKLDDRIKVIHQNNFGQAVARNVGIENAKGDYLAFIDSDDFVQPHYLEVLVDACEKNYADVSVCGFIRCLPNDLFGFVKEKLPTKASEVLLDDKMKVFLTTQKIRTAPWGKLCRKSLFDTLRYPVGKYNEDEFITYLVIHFANKVVVTDYDGYVYRYNNNSVMNTAFSLKKMNAVEGCYERMLFIEKNYPKLKKYGCRAVVYACNQVLLSMGKAKTRNTTVLKEIQPLYRKYVWYYVFTKSSVLGKFFALVSFLNVNLALKIACSMK
jgi:glycosyltransferase involved in cell wall biosynthesis